MSRPRRPSTCGVLDIQRPRLRRAERASETKVDLRTEGVLRHEHLAPGVDLLAPRIVEVEAARQGEIDGFLRLSPGRRRKPFASPGARGPSAGISSFVAMGMPSRNLKSSTAATYAMRASRRRSSARSTSWRVWSTWKSGIRPAPWRSERHLAFEESVRLS